MAQFRDDELTAAVIDRMQGAADPRLREIMTALVRHLHDFAREVKLNEAEWLAAIEFLTRTGQMCDDKRQEIILLSDTLGLSMLVDALSNRREGRKTPSTVLGHSTSRARLSWRWIRISPRTPKGGSRPWSAAACWMRKATDRGRHLDVWQTPPWLYHVQMPRPRIQSAGRFRRVQGVYPSHRQAGNFRATNAGGKTFALSPLIAGIYFNTAPFKVNTNSGGIL